VSPAAPSSGAATPSTAAEGGTHKRKRKHRSKGGKKAAKE